jgi:hypothetical protein
MPDVDPLDRLRLMYEQNLRRGPFPTEECYIAGFGDGSIRLELDLFLADIAGIASHGQKLKVISTARRLEFLRISSSSFWDRFPSPEIRERITVERTPSLFRLMEDAEEARQLILHCLE